MFLLVLAAPTCWGENGHFGGCAALTFALLEPLSPDSPFGVVPLNALFAYLVQVLLLRDVIEGDVSDADGSPTGFGEQACDLQGADHRVAGGSGDGGGRVQVCFVGLDCSVAVDC